jgi:hypothetical protein
MLRGGSHLKLQLHVQVHHVAARHNSEAQGDVLLHI